MDAGEERSPRAGVVAGTVAQLIGLMVIETGQDAEVFAKRFERLLDSRQRVIFPDALRRPIPHG